MTAKKYEGIIVTGGNVNIGYAAVGTGASISVLVNESIAKSIKRTKAINDKPELQQALKELCDRIADLTNRLSSAEQTKVCRDLEDFVSEATSPTPRKPWYELSGNGLIEAAKSVANLATPVVTAVKTILGLLSS